MLLIALVIMTMLMKQMMRSVESVSPGVMSQGDLLPCVCRSSVSLDALFCARLVSDLDHDRHLGTRRVVLTEKSIPGQKTVSPTLVYYWALS